MPKREYEAVIFTAFLNVKPDFAGEKIVEWKQPPDEKEFPDVICATESKKRVGVEIGEWLNEEQLTHAKSMERAQDALLKAIGPQGDNKTDNIYFIWLHPHPRARIKPADTEKLRDELWRLVSDTDKQWPARKDWHSPQGYFCSRDDLKPYPTLSKYVHSLTFFPRDWYEGWPPDGRWIKRTLKGVDWIIFPARGGPYSENTMLQPLLELLAEKMAHYSSVGTGFDELDLLVPYNQAWIYNAPAETPDFKFADAASRAREFLAGDFGPFRRIFLFVATGEGEVIEL